MNVKPNLEYLVKSYNGTWGNIIHKKIFSGPSYLHEDGWLEVTVPMSDASVERRSKAKEKAYAVLKADRGYSEVRHKFLESTISFLEKHGTVFLVRIPVPLWMEDFEKELMPNFDQVIEELAEKESVEYFNLTGSDIEYQFTDGNHLYKESGKQVSETIARRIVASRTATEEVIHSPSERVSE